MMVAAAVSYGVCVRPALLEPWGQTFQVNYVTWKCSSSLHISPRQRTAQKPHVQRLLQPHCMASFFMECEHKTRAAKPGTSNCFCNPRPDAAMPSTTLQCLLQPSPLCFILFFRPALLSIKCSFLSTSPPFHKM